MQHPVLKSWLQLQSKSLGSTRAASVRVQPDCLPSAGGSPPATIDGELENATSDDWFATVTTQPQETDALDELLSVATTSRSVVVATPDSENQESDGLLRIAQPIEVQGRVCGAVAIAIEYEGEGQQDKAVRLLQWGTAWLDLLLRHSTVPDTSESVNWRLAWHQELPELLRDIASHESLQLTLMTVVNFLAHRLGLEYAAIGLRRGEQFKVDALSDNAAISQQSEIAERLSQQMQRTLASICQHDDDAQADQERPVTRYVPMANGSMGAPLTDNDGIYAVLIAQPRADEPATPALIEAVNLSAELLGPVIAIKRRQQHGFVARTKERARAQRERLSTRSGLTRMVLMSCALLAAVFVMASDIPFLVSGDARVEGAVQRAVIAPFDGFVEQAYVRAGERVNEGDLLAELDDAELRLRLRQLQGDKGQARKEYREALAGFDKSQAKILEAQLEQATARIDQVRQQLTRTQLRAPFAGTVVSGDLSRALGKPVQRGETLFEVAPLNEYRVAITVNDRDIAQVEAQQTGSLVLAALASHELNIVVANIAQLPDDTQHPGEFRVEARLVGEVAALRPGMRGIAKIETGERPRWKVWSHSLTDWMRYQVWQWLP